MSFWFGRAVISRRIITLEQLEERIVLDAAVDSSAQENNEQNHSEAPQDAGGDQTAPAEASGAPQSQDGQTSDPLGEVFNQDLNVVLISNALDQVEAISQAAVDDAEVVVFDAENDDMGSIVDALTSLADSTGKQIGHLAILSHGAPGTIALGQDAAFSNLSQGPDLVPWQELRQYLTEDARIDLYGCNTGYGEDGLELVTKLSDLTGATVWASDDNTGSEVNADWVLEIRSGDDPRGYLIDEAAGLGAVDNLGTITVTSGYGWSRVHMEYYLQNLVPLYHESVEGSDFVSLSIEGCQDIDGIDFWRGEYDHTTLEYLTLSGPWGFGGSKEIDTIRSSSFYFSETWSTFPIQEWAQGWTQPVFLCWDYYSESSGMEFRLHWGSDVADDSDNFEDYMFAAGQLIGYLPPLSGHDNYLTVELTWLPGPYAVGDLNFSVNEQTEGYFLDLSDYFRNAIDGPVSSFSVEYTSDMISNAVAVENGIIFDTGETLGQHFDTGLMIRAYDGGGRWSEHWVDITINETQVVTAIPFTVRGIHTEPIEVDGWGIDSILESDPALLQIKITDAPDWGFLFLNNHKIVEGDIIDIEDADNVCYVYMPSDIGQYKVNGFDGLHFDPEIHNPPDEVEYVAIYDYNGEMGETPPATATIEYEYDTQVRVFEDCEQVWSGRLLSSQYWYYNNPALYGEFSVIRDDTVTMLDTSELHGYIEYRIWTYSENLAEGEEMTDAWGGITNPRVLEEGCSYDTATHYEYYKIAFFRYVPDDDFYGHAWATVSHTGGAGGWVDTIDITVLPRNDEPSIDGNLVLTPDPATEDGSILATGLSISDVDLDYYQGNVNDLDYTLQFELEAVGYPDEHPFALEFDNGLSLTDDGNGMWSVTAGFTDINEALTSGLRVDLLDDFHGQVSVTMTVLDNGNIDHFFPQESLTDSINWEFSVQPTYDPPNAPAATAFEVVADEGPDLITLDGWGMTDPLERWGDQDNPLHISLGNVTEVLAVGDLFLDGATRTELHSGSVIEWANVDLVRFDPDDDFFGEISFTYTVTDDGDISGGGENTSDPALVSINIQPKNDSPLILGFPSIDPVMEGGSTVVQGLSISDLKDTRHLDQAEVDALEYAVYFTVEAVNFPGTFPFDLSFGNGSSISDSDGDGTWEAYGSISDINAALDSGLLLSLSYGMEEFHGDVSITLVVDDHGNVDYRGGDYALQDSGSWNFTVQPVNDDPSIDMPAALETVEDHPVTLYGADIYDPDMDYASDRSRPFQITFVATADDSGAASGTLSLLDDSGVTASRPGEGMIVLTGTYDNLKTALVTGLEFDPAADFYGNITVRGTVSDLGNVGQGDVKGDWSETHITVTGVNDRPVISLPDEITTMVNSTVGLSMISVDDPDSAYAPPGSQDIQVDVSVDSGSLSLTSPVTVTGDLDGTEGTMRFVGSPDSVNEAFKSLVFSPAYGFVGKVTLTLEVNDNGNYGAEDPLQPLSCQEWTLISVLPDPPSPQILDRIPIPSFYGTGEPLSTVGLMPAIGNLLAFLSSEALLPFSFTADHGGDTGHPSDAAQLGTLIQEALLGEPQESKNQGWSNLFSFVSGKKVEGKEEWLGLEDFFLKLEEWQAGKSLDEILLVFNADEVKLAEWFNSLMSSLDNVLGNEQSATLEPHERFEQWFSTKGMVFDMHEMRVADLLSHDLRNHGQSGACDTHSEPNHPVCIVFDLHSLSLVDVLAG
ncbi:MAG: DUF4347 domain-containing protein [Desulfomonilaceae bacterium]|nr:DUF4347 domain-containing protein [Desulfomonilaceae bacterium]